MKYEVVLSSGDTDGWAHVHDSRPDAEVTLQTLCWTAIDRRWRDVEVQLIEVDGEQRETLTVVRVKSNQRAKKEEE